MNNPPKQRNYRQLHALLSSTGLSDQKANIINGISGGRTDSSRDLTDYEFKSLLNWLQTQFEGSHKKADRERKKILSLCYTYGLTVFDPAKGRDMVDMKALNTWMLKYSYLHKPLNDYTLQELPKLVTQFESVVSKHLKNINI